MVYNPKSTSIKELEDSRNLGIQSKMKFNGDFKQLSKELVAELEVAISKEIVPNYGVEYTIYGDVISKFKIKDKDLMVEKLITCTLFFNKNDIRYGNITPLFTSEEKNQKTKKHELVRFSITDRESIIKAIVRKLGEIIEEF